MTNRRSSLAVAALFALSMPFANIALAMPVAGALAYVKSPTNIETVQWRGGGYYGGGYYGRGWYGPGWGVGAGLLGGAIIGGMLAAPSYYGSGPYYGYYAAPGYYGPRPGDAVAYCVQRFRSYDPNSGTYLGYDGYRHPCP